MSPRGAPLGNNNAKRDVIVEDFCERLSIPRKTLYDRAKKLGVDAYSYACTLDAIEFGLHCMMSYHYVTPANQAKIKNFFDNRPLLKSRIKFYKQIVSDIDRYAVNSQGFDKTLVYLIYHAKL